MTPPKYSAQGVPLVQRYEGGVYWCLRDHRYAHEIAHTGCDCMRKRRPPLPFRVLGGLLGILGWFAWMGGTGLAVALKTADEKLRVGP